MKRLSIVTAAIVAMAISGCATIAEMKITRESLDESIRDYNQMLRWEEGPSASSFVTEKMKPEYMDKATGFNRVRVVDYRIKSVDFKKEQKKATVTVEYDYHLKSSLNIKTLSDTQKWEYDQKNKPEGWRVTSYPPAFP